MTVEKDLLIYKSINRKKINKIDCFHMETLFIKRYGKKELKSIPYKPTNKKYSKLWKSLNDRSQ